MSVQMDSNMSKKWLILLITIQSTMAASLHNFEREDLLINLADTNFCSSLLLSDEMGISLNELAKIYTEQKELGVNANLDLCCRSHYECSRLKLESNETTHSKYWNCECESKFRTCLQQLNTQLSNELGFGRSVYVKQCISEDYPIVKCVQYEEFLSPTHRFEGSPNKRDFELNYARCLQYQFDETQPKQIQLFDLPFNYNGLTPNELQRLKRNHNIRNFLHKIHGFAEMLHIITKDIRNIHRNFNF